jgi:DNA-binding FadR family transcriptional regulator
MTRSKSFDIASNLRFRIESGTWPSNTALPNERQLASEFAVARNTIRRALHELETENLIRREVGRGTIVNQRTSDELHKVLERVSGASPLDILNLRLIIEPQVAAVAAVHASARDLAAIEQANIEAVAAHELADHEKWDTEFHNCIYAATHNEFLMDFNKLLVVVRQRAPMMAIRQRAFTEERRLNYCEHHAQILAALKTRNATSASEAMRHHLATRRKNYFGE